MQVNLFIYNISYNSHTLFLKKPNIFNKRLLGKFEKNLPTPPFALAYAVGGYLIGGYLIEISETYLPYLIKI